MRLPLHPPILNGLANPGPDEDEVVPTLRDHFSFSQLDTYLKCGEKYRRKYIKGDDRPSSLPMAIGTVVHSAVENNSRWKIARQVDRPLHDLLDLTSDLHDAEHIDVPGTPQEKGDNKDHAIGVVTLYRTVHAPLIVPALAEHRFTVQVDPNDQYPEPTLPVIGYIDLIGSVPFYPGTSSVPVMRSAIEDTKVVSKARTQLEIDVSPQLTLYDWVTYQQTQSLAELVGYRQFKWLSDGPHVDATYRTPQTLENRMYQWERVQQQVRAVQDLIRREVFIPVDNPITCNMCDYKTDCRVKP